MRGLFPLFLLFSLSIALANSSPLHLRDRPSDEFESRLEDLEDFLEDRKRDTKKLLKKKKDSSPGIIGNLPPVGELFEGDIIMDERLRRAVLGGVDNEKRDVLKNQNLLWKNGLVPYVFQPHIAPDSKECLVNAIKQFHKHTCIRFVKIKNQKDKDKYKNYLYFESDKNVCSSFVGRKKGKQVVHIGHGCTRIGTCEHEILHALGMIHEQSRPDRDDHVSIKWDNIKEAEHHNFNKYSYNLVTNEDVEYNFASVMHYPNHAFAIDRSLPTIVSKKDPNLVFGQRVRFSEGDVQQINRLYKCPIDKYSSDLIATLSDAEIDEDMVDENFNEY